MSLQRASKSVGRSVSKLTFTHSKPAADYLEVEVKRKTNALPCLGRGRQYCKILAHGLRTRFSWCVDLDGQDILEQESRPPVSDALLRGGSDHTPGGPPCTYWDVVTRHRLSTANYVLGSPGTQTGWFFQARKHLSQYLCYAVMPRSIFFVVHLILWLYAFVLSHSAGHHFLI